MFFQNTKILGCKFAIFKTIGKIKLLNIRNFFRLVCRKIAT